MKEKTKVFLILNTLLILHIMSITLGILWESFGALAKLWIIGHLFFLSLNIILQFLCILSIVLGGKE